MALSDDEVALSWVRQEIGIKTPPTDDELDEWFDLLDDKVLVVIKVLKERRAALVRSPGRLSVPGQVSIDNTANIKALDDQIKRLMALAPVDVDAGGGLLDTATLVRPGRQRGASRPAGLPSRLT